MVQADNSWFKAVLPIIRGSRRFGLEPRIIGLEPRIIGLEPRIIGLEPRRSLRFKYLLERFRD